MEIHQILKLKYQFLNVKKKVIGVKEIVFQEIVDLLK